MWKIANIYIFKVFFLLSMYKYFVKLFSDIFEYFMLQNFGQIIWINPVCNFEHA